MINNDELFDEVFDKKLFVDYCRVCLGRNTYTSIKLNCGCNAQFHRTCIEDKKISYISHCPVCGDYVYQFNLYNEIVNNVIVSQFISCLDVVKQKED